MAPPELTSRLQFLNDSAHLLSSSAPETSRYLMSKCNTLMFDNYLEPSPAQKRRACSACGSIIVLGWGGTVSIEKARRTKLVKQTKRETKAAAGIAAMVYTCETCGGRTRQTVDVSTRPSRNTTMFTRAKKAIASMPSASVSGVGKVGEVKASGKKRKNKKNGGLEALLAKRKTVETKGSGFDLMDFMKKA